MCRIFFVCVFMAVLISNIVFPVSADSIHYISTEEELYLIENNPNGKYILTNNIYIESPHKMMFSNSNNSFKGILDGNGYTIYNLKIESNDAPYLAFIGFLGANGVIKNLNFDDSIITTQKEDTFLSAIVAKNISGRIENCVFRGVLSIAGKVLDKPHYVCAVGDGDNVESFYYLKYGSHLEPSSELTATESISSNHSSTITYVESVNSTSKESSSNIASSTPKTSSVSKKQTSSSDITESSTVYGDTSSAVIEIEEEQSGKFAFYAATILLLFLISYMIYTEFKFRKNQKNDKK